MDLKQLEYIVKISEEGNITKASQKLFISQPALNQQLLKLYPVFIRGTAVQLNLTDKSLIKYPRSMRLILESR